MCVEEGAETRTQLIGMRPEPGTERRVSPLRRKLSASRKTVQINIAARNSAAAANKLVPEVQ